MHTTIMPIAMSSLKIIFKFYHVVFGIVYVFIAIEI